MKLGLNVRSKKTTRGKPARRSLTALAAHGSFAPGLGLWGALLGGLVVMVVPPVLIEQAMTGTLMATFDIPQQLVLSLTAATIVGGLLFIAALNLHGTARRNMSVHPVMQFASRRVRPIDPARDLGSRSLDDPIEAMPFASPAWRDADLDDVRPAARAVMETRLHDVPAADLPAAPLALDLAEFAQLPGRNAVWVEEPVAAPVAAPAAPSVMVTEPPLLAKPAASTPEIRQRRRTAPVPQPGTAALTRLRTMPPSELSMAEMVERFAGALHEHRAAPAAKAVTGAELAAREAALADALKALAALSGGMPPQGQASAREEPLRAALAQLHHRRGVA